MSSRGQRGKSPGRGKRRGGGRGRGRGIRGNRNQYEDSTTHFNLRANESVNNGDNEIEKLTEEDVGITEYISNLEGFSGVIKSRFSDFHVNEINLDGNVAKLTDLNDLPSPEIPVDIDIDESDEYPTSLIPKDIWDKIKGLVKSNDTKSVVEIDVTPMSKQDRTQIHESVKDVFKNKVIGSTITREANKYVTFRLYDKKNKTDKRQMWPKERGGEYVHFLVYKEHVDTISATFKLAECLQLNASKFCYAGVKDRRAKSTQWFSVRKMEPSKIIARTKLFKNIHVGNFCYKPGPLKLGQLKGNRFRIALRDVTADDDIINRALESLKNKGFINYYGLQRFGNNKDIPTHEIGVQLLKGNWKEAIELILKPRKFEQDSDITAAKMIYQETGSAAKACEKLKKHSKCVESKLLAGLMAHNKNDYVNALENIPRNMRLLYIHAYQSLVWNTIVSRRIKTYGLQPVVGDIVIEGDIENAEDCFITSADVNMQSELQEENLVEKKMKRDVNVKILKEEDLNKYTIYDIVLPLPGYDIVYPTSDIKKWYEEILASRELSLEMPKQKVKLYTLSGAYRKIVERVTKLSWKTIGYDNPNDDLIRSDYEELRNYPEPKNVPNAKYKGLVIDFCLSPSCYATMTLREIMKMDTSIAAHISLSKQMRNNDNTDKCDKMTKENAETSTKSAQNYSTITTTEADSTSEMKVEQPDDSNLTAKAEATNKTCESTAQQKDLNQTQPKADNIPTDIELKIEINDKNSNENETENDSISKINMVLKTAINTEDSLKAGGELQIKTDIICKVDPDVTDINSQKTILNTTDVQVEIENVCEQIGNKEATILQSADKRKIDDDGPIGSKKRKSESEN